MRALALVSLFAVLTSGSLAALPAWLTGRDSKAGPDVLVVADASPTVPEHFRPTPEKPIYYILLGSVERTLGQSIAGEPQPDKATLEKEVVRSLATQGFVQTRLGGPLPQLAIVVSWGNANLITHDMEETAEDGSTSTTTFVLNRQEIARIVGAHQVRNRMLSPSDSDAINDAARQDRLYLFIGAFDAMALSKKQKKMLWSTWMSIESLRNSLPKALPVMLASAAAYYGKSTEAPIFIDDALRKKAEVQIGTPVVVPDAPAASAPRKK